MTEQLQEIGRRLSALRKIANMAPEIFCEKTGITAQELAAYEKGELDFSFSFLYNAARILDVDVIDLMSGDSPHLSDWCIVRKGEGYVIDRRAAYKYNHLAFTFRNKKAEPFMVTVEPKEEKPVAHFIVFIDFHPVGTGFDGEHRGEQSYGDHDGNNQYDKRRVVEDRQAPAARRHRRGEQRYRQRDGADGGDDRFNPRVPIL